MTITGSHVIKTTSELQLQIASSDFGAEACFFADKCCHMYGIPPGLVLHVDSKSAIRISKLQCYSLMYSILICITKR